MSLSLNNPIINRQNIKKIIYVMSLSCSKVQSLCRKESLELNLKDLGYKSLLIEQMPG